jgi:hypothetical protein
MQHNRNPAGASPTPPASTTVVGLGVCDVLRVDLDPSQLPVLLEEIERQRQVYEEAIGGALDAEDQESLDRLRRERRTLATMAEQLRPLVERPVIWGPAPIISDMVACAARSAVEQLDAVIQRERLTRRDRVVLLEAAHAAAAWAETFIALRAVEDYSFDPDDDYVRP